jgi:hypothetical protein
VACSSRCRRNRFAKGFPSTYIKFIPSIQKAAPEPVISIAAPRRLLVIARASGIAISPVF